MLTIEGEVPEDVPSLLRAHRLPNGAPLVPPGGSIHVDTLVLCQSPTIPDALFTHLPGLMQLVVQWYNSLASLPESLGQLTGLQQLAITGCNSLASLPDSLGRLTGLQQLAITGCNSLASLPDSLGQLTGLQQLAITRCSSLASLPKYLGQLTGLKHLAITKCSNLVRLPESLGQLTGLQHLAITDCSSLASLPKSLGQLTGLKHLAITRCNSLASLPKLLGLLEGLERLRIVNCDSLASLPNSLARLRKECVIVVQDCWQLRNPETSSEGEPMSTFGRRLRRFAAEQRRVNAARQLSADKGQVLTLLERLSWVAVLLAAATFTAAITPPGGYEGSTGDLRLWGVRNNGTMVRHPDVLRQYFILDHLSFGLSLTLVVFVVACSMPRVESNSPAGEAGLIWLSLVFASGLLAGAVACGCGAFVAALLCVYPPELAAGDVWAPFAVSITLMGLAFFQLFVRWVNIFPGVGAVWDGVKCAVGDAFAAADLLWEGVVCIVQWLRDAQKLLQGTFVSARSSSFQPGQDCEQRMTSVNTA